MFVKRRSSLAARTATSLNEQLNTLNEILKQSVHAAQYYGISKPSPTLYGKIEQANKWFANPFLDDNGLGIAQFLETSYFFELLVI